jgi:hypothetical protein
MPRPRKNLTPEQVEQVERLAAVLRMEDIADFLGISSDTLRRRMNEDPAVRQAYKRGRQRAIAGVATSLLQQARDGNLTAMIFYLKTQAGWRETKHVEANVTNGALVIDLVNDDDGN